jgi:tetratricopeptide (TPR) repeat protein
MTTNNTLNLQKWTAAQRNVVSYWMGCIERREDLDGRPWNGIEGQLYRFETQETLDLVLALEHFMLERGHWRTLEFCTAEALNHCRSVGDWIRFVRMAMASGRLYFRQGYAIKASIALEEGEAACEKISDPLVRETLCGTILYLRGSALRLLGDQDAANALSYYDRSIELCLKSVAVKQRTQDQRGLASAFFNLGAAQTERAELHSDAAQRNTLFQEALQSLRWSQELFEIVGDKDHGDRAGIRIARILIRLGDHMQAMANMEQLNIGKEKSPRTWVDRELILARALEHLAQFSEAEAVSEEALILAKRHGMSTEIRQLSALLERVRLKSGAV